MKLRDLLAQIHEGVQSGRLDEDSEVEFQYKHPDLVDVYLSVYRPVVEIVDRGKLVVGELDF